MCDWRSKMRLSAHCGDCACSQVPACNIDSAPEEDNITCTRCAEHLVAPSTFAQHRACVHQAKVMTCRRGLTLSSACHACPCRWAGVCVRPWVLSGPHEEPQGTVQPLPIGNGLLLARCDGPDTPPSTGLLAHGGDVSGCSTLLEG
jgi:hypothetical protein